ncbi:MAG: GIY-YIG nuclease family protein [Balneolaceae bacterium]|nr:GIY-YIG nuclease family protein [Balneolaceae bacterium]
MGDVYVYILYSESKAKYYTGYSEDTKKRLIQHNLGETRSTKSGIPWVQVWQSQAMTKTEALLLERKIKKRGAKRFLEDESSKTN